MKSPWLIGFIGVLLIILSLGVVAWLRAPRLLEVTPAPGASLVSPRSPLRITFSQPLQLKTVGSRIKINPLRNGSFTWEGNTLVFTPSQPWPSGAVITVQVAGGMRSLEPLSLPMLRGQTWSFTTSQTLLAYLWVSTVGADLYALDPVTGDVHRLTITQNVLDYAISRDGLWFYYSLQEALGTTALWRQKRWEAGQALATSPTPELLFECLQAICRSPLPSPDGQWLAYERTPLDEQGQPGTPSVWLYSLADHTSHPVSPQNHPAMFPRWSPTGQLSFYEIERQGFVIQNISGQEIAFLPLRSSESAAWSPAAQSLVAMELGTQTTGSLGTFSPSRLKLYDLSQVSGRAVPSIDLTQANQIEDSSPVFSPSGEWIACARRYLDAQRWTPGKQLWLVRSDGSEALPLTQSPEYTHHDFSWSPDGKQIAFVRFNQSILTEPAGLWLIDADGSHPIELVKGGYAPQWIP